MNILNIPFIKLLGISRDRDTLELIAKERLNNHIGSMHAGALYTLAESQSGLFLQEQFNDIKVDVVPLLRDSKISYKKPAFGKVITPPTNKLHPKLPHISPPYAEKS